MKREQVTTGPIFETLRRLNWHFGRGEVVSIDNPHAGYTRLEAHRTYNPQLGMADDSFRFRVDARHVKALSHARVYRTLNNHYVKS